jgi:hypothetical protein
MRLLVLRFNHSTACHVRLANQEIQVKSLAAGQLDLRLCRTDRPGGKDRG